MCERGTLGDTDEMPSLMLKGTLEASRLDFGLSTCNRLRQTFKAFQANRKDINVTAAKTGSIKESPCNGEPWRRAVLQLIHVLGYLN
jgi:hypothetical protein